MPIKNIINKMLLVSSILPILLFSSCASGAATEMTPDGSVDTTGNEDKWLTVSRAEYMDNYDGNYELNNSTQTEYNAQGQVTKETHMIEGAISFVNVYERDEAARTSSVTRTSYKDDGTVELSYTDTTKYIDDGRISSVTRTTIENNGDDDYPGDFIREYSYSDDGKTVTVTTYQNGEATDEDILHYNDDGKLEKTIEEEASSIYREYNENGQITYDSFGGFGTRYYYDDNGSLVLTINDHGASTYYIKDENGRTIKEYSPSSNDYVHVSEYIYDDYGNRLAEVHGGLSDADQTQTTGLKIILYEFWNPATDQYSKANEDLTAYSIDITGYKAELAKIDIDLFGNSVYSIDDNSGINDDYETGETTMESETASEDTGKSATVKATAGLDNPIYSIKAPDDGSYTNWTIDYSAGWHEEPGYFGTGADSFVTNANGEFVFFVSAFSSNYGPQGDYLVKNLGTVNRLGGIDIYIYMNYETASESDLEMYAKWVTIH